VLAEFPSTLSSAGEVIRIPLLPEETTCQLDEILHHHRRFVLSEDENTSADGGEGLMGLNTISSVVKRAMDCGTSATPKPAAIRLGTDCASTTCWETRWQEAGVDAAFLYIGAQTGSSPAARTMWSSDRKVAEGDAACAGRAGGLFGMATTTSSVHASSLLKAASVECFESG
jgi:hypothetical protein